jgi:hypothetical protein
MRAFRLAFSLALVVTLAANVAFAAEDAAPAQAIVHHVPPAEAPEHEPLRLAAVVENAWAESALVARYRAGTDAEGAAFKEVPFERSSTGAYYAIIPLAVVKRPGLVYYVVGIGKDGKEVAHFASAARPHEVRVEPPSDARWIETETRRLAGRNDRVRTFVDAVGFGDSLGERDYYLRSEIDWTHRLVTRLYSFSLGYGFVEGRTPSNRDDMDPQFVTRGTRYGFGTVRLRATDTLWFDGGVLLGFSHVGFAPGVRGQIIVGRDWRTAVSVGAEVIRDLGSSWWVQLQWDTVPPLLMSAKILTTDLPGSALEGGSTLSLHADYPIGERVTVGATLSADAREHRPAAPGAGLSLALEF